MSLIGVCVGFACAMLLPEFPPIVTTIYLSILIALMIGSTVAEIFAHVKEDANLRARTIPYALVAFVPVFLLFYFI